MLFTQKCTLQQMTSPPLHFVSLCDRGDNYSASILTYMVPDCFINSKRKQLVRKLVCSTQTYSSTTHSSMAFLAWIAFRILLKVMTDFAHMHMQDVCTLFQRVHGPTQISVLGNPTVCLCVCVRERERKCACYTVLFAMICH